MKMKVVSLGDSNVRMQYSIHIKTPTLKISPLFPKPLKVQTHSKIVVPNNLSSRYLRTYHIKADLITYQFLYRT